MTLNQTNAHAPASAATIEQRTIYPIPHSERMGHPRDLFSVWFGTNTTILTVITGALATIMFQLPLTAACVALLLGNLVGGVFMALHAAQGPRLGVPQMVQTCGQFGSMGAVPMILLVVFIYVGFSASNLVVGGEGFQLALPWLGYTGGVLAVTILSAFPAFWGYRTIHTITKLISWSCGIAIIWALVCIFGNTQAYVLLGSFGHTSLSGFMGAVSVAALWQLAYAPYVSDYSRYLPNSKQGARHAFHATYWGSALGTLLPMFLGAILGIITPRGNEVLPTLMQYLGGSGSLIMTMLVIGITVANGMSIYCGSLSSLMLLQMFYPKSHFGVRTRIAVTASLMLFVLILTMLMTHDFMETYTDFLNLLMIIMIPWTSINLIDYYLVQHGSYDVASFFRSDGGCYGYYNVPALICYALGIAVQIPFVSNHLYTGPLALQLGRTDISWAVGLVLTSLIYLLMTKNISRPLHSENLYNKVDSDDDSTNAGSSF
ncbi:purine-cytosine permease family protein [Acetobacter sp.]|uniref:purine-cytosine permease family protein n=1 Tax=Acetobacter sp. TaxID=440 RepID=UPI0039E83CF5